MSVAEKREREKRQRYNEILDAAETIFFSKGVDPATMDQIAEAANVSKGTLYLYFKSKEEVYGGVCARGMEIMLDRFRQATTGDAPGIDKVESVGRAYFQFMHDFPSYFNSMMHFNSRHGDISDPESQAAKTSDIGRSCNQVVIDAIAEGIADGSIRGDLDPVKTGYILWGTATGIAMIVAQKGEMVRHKAGFDPSILFEQYLSFTRKSLASGD